MNKQVVIFINLTGLYNILNEIKNFISFDIKNYINKDDFFQDLNKNNILAQSTIVTNSIENFNSDNKNIDKRNILTFRDFPMQINAIIDQINIQLIKQRYDFQSKINIKNYNLNLNSRKISKNERDLKLTEREIDIILFLKKQKEPKTIEVLQKEIWHYSSDLETHTVETHIYRLRKKIKDQFKDENFIVSYKDGYSIE